MTQWKITVGQKTFNVFRRNGLLAILPVFLLITLDYILISGFSILQKLIQTTLILTLLFFSHCAEPLAFQIVPNQARPRLLWIHLLRFGMISLVIFIGYEILADQIEWREKILNIFFIYLWFSLTHYLGEVASKNQKKGRLLIILIASFFLYFFWTEASVWYQTGAISLYPSSLDFISLVVAGIIGIEFFFRLIRYFHNKGHSPVWSHLMVSIIVLFYSLIIYEPYLRLIHRTTLLRYEDFWYQELPLVTFSILFLNIYRLFIDKKEASSVSHDGAYSDELRVKGVKKDTIIPISSIAYVTIQNAIAIAYTFEGEKYILDQTLNELEEQLNPRLFFRVNRQLVLSIKNIWDYKKDVNQKLNVYYHSANGGKEDAIISRYKAPKFKKWYRGM